MIKPTVGRVVLFHPASTAMTRPSSQPHAALIAYVHGDRMINVGAFDSNGNPYGKTSVTLLQDNDSAPSGGYYAEWMPYQKGQAAKTEELETKLKEIA